MTIPNGSRPATGCIRPSEYRTTGRYVAYVDAIAWNGHVVCKPGLRGHGDSEGGDTVEGGSYRPPAYTVDALNAWASPSAHEEADPGRMNMWGNLMAGQTILRAKVVSGDITAGVMWASDIAPYPDLIAYCGSWGQVLRTKHGTAGGIWPSGPRFRSTHI
jgi:hypothetical protein